MAQSFSRREFLKLGSLALGVASLPASSKPLVAIGGLIGRVSYETVSVFNEPLLNADATVAYRQRDELLNIYYSLSPLAGPAYNPLWYRIAEGYVHSGLIQPVGIMYNSALETLPVNGQLCRVTIPYTRPYNYSSSNGWQPESLYQLYYDSHHWVTDIVEGPDGEPWYQITEAWENVQYYAAAAHLQAVPDEELAPISPDIPAVEKRVEISIALQTLTAYEGNSVVLRVPISTGVRNSGASGLPTETPTGTFNIYSKLPTKYMGDNRLTDTLGDRYLPGVPWTSFFAEGGYAIHGSYWHNNFGAPMSRGCVNMKPEDAKWLYRWMTPQALPSDQETRGRGTRIVVS